MISRPKKQLLDLIKRHGKISLENAMEATGLTKTTLREHFSQLERDGFIHREYLRQGPGRPSLYYQLSESGEAIYPTTEPQLLKELIAYLKSRGLEYLVESFFQQYWEKRLVKAEQLLAEYPEDDTASRLNALKQLLEEEGFMPEWQVDEDNGQIKVTECNCPFREIVKETSLPCKLEVEFYQSLFGTEIRRESYIPDGQHACSYVIPKENA